MIGFLAGEIAACLLSRGERLTKTKKLNTQSEVNNLACTRALVDTIRLYHGGKVQEKSSQGLYFRDMNNKLRESFYRSYSLYNPCVVNDTRLKVTFLTCAFATGQIALSEIAAIMMAPKISASLSEASQFEKASKALSVMSFCAKATKNKWILLNYMNHHYPEVYSRAIKSGSFDLADKDDDIYEMITAIVIKSIHSSNNFEDALVAAHELGGSYPEILSLVGGIAGNLWECPRKLSDATYALIERLNGHAIPEMKELGILNGYEDYAARQDKKFNKRLKRLLKII